MCIRDSIIGGSMGVIINSGAIHAGIGAVSYTHLPVYSYNS